MAGANTDLGRYTLAVLAICGLIAASVWILAPFVGAFVWATMIVVATWPLLLQVERACGGRRTPAVVILALALLTVLVLPLLAGVQAVLGHADEVAALLERLPLMQLPEAPDWVGRIPLAGVRLQRAWNEVAVTGVAALLAQAQPYIRTAFTWLAGHFGTVAGMFVQSVLIVILAAVLYAGGESWAAWVRGLARKLADDRGDRMVILAGQAIRGVAMGVVVTAIVQSALGGIGLAIVGVPFAGPLTALMFLLCIAQVGPILVLLGATAWAFSHLGAGWGAFMLVWALVIGLMDNVLRPALIKRGADLPMLLIFAGVIGGLVALGVVGVFVGPVVLAVTYTLLDDWIAPGRSAA